mgnify:CR=1 FL=1
MNNHFENFGGAEIRLFWGFSHLHYHRENGFSSSIIHNENAFIVRILSRRDAFGAIIARKVHSHDEYLPGKKNRVHHENLDEKPYPSLRSLSAGLRLKKGWEL